MFSENEIATMVDIVKIDEAVASAKKSFIEEEANFLEISDHDFLALIMMTPAIGVALANGSVSLFEELALNKMARKMSKGGYFLKMDPVAHAMKFLIKSFDKWEDHFYEVINVCMEETIDHIKLKNLETAEMENPIQAFARELMNVPYIFVRFLSTMVLNDESDIVEQRSISQVEYDKILNIGERLKFDEVPVFRSFCKTFEVK